MRLASVQAGDFKLISPDKNLAVEIKLKEKIYYSVTFKEERVLEASPLSITIDNARGSWYTQR